ncbi:hypothetical protein Tco_0411607 [Tanacetum coccineum]
MADLAFVQQHNMVAYLEKNDGNADFHQILDFLTSSSINFALTVSPTIYASYIEQFWNTASLKTINSEKQIHAKVNGKAVVVSESSVRRDLHLNDEDGTACLTVNEIFENLALMGYETASDKLTFYKQRNLDPKKFLMYPRFLKLFLNIQLPNLVIPFNDIYETPKLTKKVFTNMRKPGKGFSGRVTQLFQNMLAPPVVVGEVATATTSQPPKDPNTYRRTKRGRNTKVPQSGGSPKKVGDEAINEAMFDSVERAITTDASLDAAQDSDNITNNPIHGNNLIASPSGKGSCMVTLGTKKPWGGAPAQNRSERVLEQPIEPPLSEGHTNLEVGHLHNQKEEIRTRLSDFDGFDDETVDAATTGVSIASAPVTTVGTLIKMKEEKAKEKGVAFKDVEDSSRPVRSITTLQPLPSIDPKDKGKGILVEGEPVKVKRKDQGLAQIESDAELAHRLHEEELAEIERIQKEKAAQEEVSMAAIYEEYDTIQASIDADALFAAKLQQEDREQYTIEERAKFLAETIATQRKFRSGYKHSQLKGKTYEEIQGLYEREQKFIHDFVPMDSEKEEKKSMEPESEGKKSKRLKRIAGSYATQKSPKKPKVMKSVKNVTEEEAAEYEKEKEELRLSLKIIFGDDSEVNYEPLSRRFPIVNWEYKLLGNVDAKDMYVYKLTRADGSSSYHGDMQAFLRRLDRQDLNDLYRMLFDPDEKDKLWMNQLDWKFLKWKLYESCGVHTLFMDGTPMEINMLVEKKYPPIKELLEKMLNLQLEAEKESTMAFELIKFIKSMLEE